MNSAPVTGSLTVKVSQKEQIADGIFLFELKPTDGGELPAFTPGSHITVTAPSG